MLVELYREFKIEPAPQKLRCNGVTGYKARAYVSPSQVDDRCHRPVADHDRLFDSHEAAARASLEIGRNWVDAHAKEAAAAEFRSAERRHERGTRDTGPAFAHRAPSTLSAVWQRAGTAPQRTRGSLRT